MHVLRTLATALAFAGVLVSARAQSPPVTDGLVLWLHADSLSLTNGQPVTTWTDSSGYGNDVTTNNTSFNPPTFVTNAINGRPAVYFQSGLALSAGSDPSLSATNVTIFSVFRAQSTGLGSIVDMANPSPLSENYDVITGSGANEERWYFQWYNGGFGNVNVLTSYTNNFVIRTDSRAGDGAAPPFETQDIYNDRANILHGTGYQSIVTNASNRLTVGYYQVGSTGYFDGQIAEILIYNTALSDSDRQWVWNYLGDKYGITIPEPATVTLSTAGIGAIALLISRRKPSRV